MKKSIPLILLLALLLFGCAQQTSGEVQGIPFEEGQLYALAYLGYQESEKLDDFCAKYLDDAQPPVHYLSDGDYYLIIPRSETACVRLYQNDLETDRSTLFYEQSDGRPFVVQCNVSDIFPDLTVEIVDGDETVRFSPFISLENGEVQRTERGLLLGE